MKSSIAVVVRALQVTNHGNGLYSLTLPSRDLDKTESKVLHELFPHTLARAFDLLAEEAVLEAIVPEASLDDSQLEKAETVSVATKAPKY
jgi:hypothetical protein